MDYTQRLDIQSDDDDDVLSDSFKKKVFGKFVFLKCDDENRGETSFDIVGGENKIGRDAEQSSIVLDTRVRTEENSFSKILNGFQLLIRAENLGDEVNLV